LQDTTDLKEIKKKSLAGVGSLVKRQIIIKTLFLIGTVILARILEPQVFGIYDIVTFIVLFFSTFGDVGLGAALIRKKGEISKEELSTTFWLQQSIVISIAVLVVAAAPLSLKIYPLLPSVAVWLIRVMALSFMLMSLKTIPAILMERNLDFNKIAWVDISENLVYQATAIIFAISGFGVWSFIFAALVRAGVGVILIYTLSSWRPIFYYKFSLVRESIKFGLPYQLNGILNFMKDAVTPLFVGAYAGAAAVGYVNWARTLAFAPLIFSASFERVAFPTFSKIHEDRALLTRTIERSIRNMTMLMFPITALMIALGPDIIRIVFTEKWMPGIWAFYLYCTSPLVIGIMLPMYSAILSLGKSTILLKMTLILLSLEWGLGIPFVINFGFTGIALNQPIIAALFLMIYRTVLKSENITLHIFTNIRWQFGLAIITGIIVKISAQHLHLNIVTLSVLFLSGCLIFTGLIYIMQRETALEFKNYALSIVGKGER
jgi:PST family polysaccharide transporter